jgi:ankyrin repeat protein
MSQTDIDAFVVSAGNGKLTPEGVMTAVVTKGIPVNGRRSAWGWTALHWAVYFERRKLVVALLAAGGDANAKDNDAMTPMWSAAAGFSNADILRLLIDGGGSVNEADIVGRTPLISLVRNNRGNAAARLQLLLRCPELDLDTKYNGMTAEEWAVSKGRSQPAVAIAEERRRRVRWSAVRCAWIAGTMLTNATASIASCNIHLYTSIEKGVSNIHFKDAANART